MSIPKHVILHLADRHLEIIIYIGNIIYKGHHSTASSVHWQCGRAQKKFKLKTKKDFCTKKMCAEAVWTRKFVGVYVCVYICIYIYSIYSIYMYIYIYIYIYIPEQPRGARMLGTW